MSTPSSSRDQWGLYAADDLDGDGKLKFLLLCGLELHIRRWEADKLKTAWQRADMPPSLRPLPTEGYLRLTSGSSALAKGNIAVWRVQQGCAEFLLRFPDVVRYYSERVDCRYCIRKDLGRPRC